MDLDFFSHILNIKIYICTSVMYFEEHDERSGGSEKEIFP